MGRLVPPNSLPDPDGQAKWLQTRPGERCLIRVPATDTNGAYSVVEIVSAPGDGTPLHVHQNEDEHLIVGVSRSSGIGVNNNHRDVLHGGNVHELATDFGILFGGDGPAKRGQERERYGTK